MTETTTDLEQHANTLLAQLQELVDDLPENERQQIEAARARIKMQVLGMGGSEAAIAVNLALYDIHRREWACQR